MKIATFFSSATGQLWLLFYWLLAGVWAFPSGFPIPFQQCPTAVQQPLRAFPSGCRLKRGNFHPLSLKGRVTVNIY
jgi:hypothetical protein